jgi:hypothetical protein
MGRINDYDNDQTISNDDKLIGSDSSNGGGTKNFSLSDLKSYFQGGYVVQSYVDGIEDALQADIDDLQTDIDGIEADIDSLKKQKLLLLSEEESISNDEPTVIRFKTITGNPSTGSINIYPGKMDLVNNNAIANIDGRDLVIKVSMSAFTNISHNNSEINFNLESSLDNVNFNIIKTVQSSKNNAGRHVDSFYSYFNFQARTYLRITVSSNHIENILLEFSSFDFEIQ